MVQHGIWKMRCESGYKDTDIDVAVKVVENQGSNSVERIKLLQEAVIMGQFKNPYILQILGIINGDHVSCSIIVYEPITIIIISELPVITWYRLFLA